MAMFIVPTSLTVFACCHGHERYYVIVSFSLHKFQVFEVAIFNFDNHMIRVVDSCKVRLLYSISG